MRAPALACLLFLTATAIAASPAWALTPEEAYAAIPHQRTPFDAGASTLPQAQADSLRRLFALSDEGVVLRVEGMRAQRSRDAAELARVLRDYDALIARLQSQPFAPEIAPPATSSSRRCRARGASSRRSPWAACGSRGGNSR